jgi:IclR family acetate operon transcriptional repressor
LVTEPGRQLSSIRRSVAVMELLARKGPLGVRAVAQQLVLPLGSVHRLLLDFEAEGVAERTPEGEWALSFRLLEITGMQLDRIELPRLARPFADRIAEETRETVNLNALHHLAGVTVDKVRGNEGMQLDMRIGARGPLHCGGAGKAMLAFLPEPQRRLVLGQPLRRLTPHTITDAAVLERELDRIAARGYSLDHDEVVVGVRCVAMPILDRGGVPVGAMSISGTSPKRPGPELERMVALLEEACGHISRRLGYAGNWPPTRVAAEAGLPQPA